jgi:peptide/nickel transport system substrate-binding protein
LDTAPPTEALQRNLRWMVLLALAGIAVLVALLGYSSLSVNTILVPDRGGVFREGVAGAPQYYSPLWCQATDVDRDICALVYRGLTTMDKNGRVVPDLAANWQIVDDRTYVFTMKPDQYWHDGQPITADDALFTIGVLQDPALLDIPGLPGLWRNVTVEKVDDLTVKFTLPQPFAPFLDYTVIGLLPKHIYEDKSAKEIVTSSLAETAVGSGPMRIVEHTPDHVRLEPSAHYAGPTPYISALEFRFYPDAPSVFAAFDGDRVDGISRILPADLPTAVARDDLQLFSSAESGYSAVLLNVNSSNAPFFQDKRVRQALLHAIDREDMIQSVLEGQGTVADSLLTPENWAYNPELLRYAYDPARARQLLDEAGWTDSDGDGVRDKDGRPLAFVLLVRDDTLHQQLGVALAAAWAELGVKAELQQVSFSGLVGDFLVPRTFDAALTDWDQVGDPDPFPQWHSSQVETGGQNYSGWQNADADRLMEEARKTTDAGERAELYRQFQSIFTEELPALLLYHPVFTYGVSRRVNNVQIGALNSPAERFATFPQWYIDLRRVPANQAPADLPPTPPGGIPAPTE